MRTYTIHDSTGLVDGDDACTHDRQSPMKNFDVSFSLL